MTDITSGPPTTPKKERGDEKARQKPERSQKEATDAPGEQKIGLECIYWVLFGYMPAYIR